MWQLHFPDLSVDCLTGVNGMGMPFDPVKHLSTSDSHFCRKVSCVSNRAGICPGPVQRYLKQRFNEMRDIITSIVGDLHIRESNCPVGARVVVVSYNSGTSYLIRGSDYRSKRFFSFSQISKLWGSRGHWECDEVCGLGTSLSGRLQEPMCRELLCFSNGQAASRSSVITAHHGV